MLNNKNFNDDMDEEKGNAGFDFDTWSAMAQQDPEKFEVMRQRLIDDLIEKTPAHLKPRIIGLQWQIDQIRRQADNPLSACLQISQKMWNHVVGESGLIDALGRLQSMDDAPKKASAAKILSLDKYKSTE